MIYKFEKFKGEYIFSRTYKDLEELRIHDLHSYNQVKMAGECVSMLIPLEVDLENDKFEWINDKEQSFVFVDSTRTHEFSDTARVVWMQYTRGKKFDELGL